MFTILEGSTFCICDDLGDVGEATSGLFAEDTRFLSRLKLTINGMTPLPLSAGKVEYFSAAFFLRNPLVGGLRQDQVSIVRFRGNIEAAADVYRGVTPLSADDVAECVLFAVTRPLHVNVDEIVVKALQQSSGSRIHREEP